MPITANSKRLNQATVVPCNVLLDISECIDQLGGISVFSVLDLVSGFYQAAIREDSIPLTTIVMSAGFAIGKLPSIITCSAAVVVCTTKSSRYNCTLAMSSWKWVGAPLAPMGRRTIENPQPYTCSHEGQRRGSRSRVPGTPNNAFRVCS